MAIKDATRLAMKREDDRLDAMRELSRQLALYDIRDLSLPQPDGQRQFMADVVNNILRSRLGIDRIYDLAGLLQAAHAAAIHSIGLSPVPSSPGPSRSGIQ